MNQEKLSAASEQPQSFEYSREAAKITLDKVRSWEELNAATLQAADEKFKEAWQEAQNQESEHGDPAYWFWKGILLQKLPTRQIALST
jgi:hypothetical protein